MVTSTEKVTDDRQKTNVFFLTLVSSLLSISIFIGKEFSFSVISLWVMFGISFITLIMTIFWLYTVHSYRLLNKGKFALIYELEDKLKSNIFEREWKILKEGVKYKETSYIEKVLVITFICITSITALIEIGCIFLIRKVKN